MGRPPAVPSRERVHDRLRIALAGSALLHLAATSTLVPPHLPGSPRGHGEPVPLTVRLARAPAAPAAPAIARVAPGPDARPKQHFRADAELPTRKCCSGLAGLLPAPADPTVYTAGELDSLPTPVAPLDLGGLPMLASMAPVRLELTIDEHGVVHSVSIAGRPEGLPETELRSLIAASAFVPARKDGRAVKSRIVLGVQ
jgi:hypothetical protein